jgi:hypothetical protein
LLDYLDAPIPIITWLREPVARELSNYQYIRAQYGELSRIANDYRQPGWIEYYDFVRSKSLVEVCQSESYLGYCDNLQTRYLSGVFPSEVPVHLDRGMLNRAKENLAKFWHFGLCEWMLPSIDLLSYRLACPRRPLDIRANRSFGDSAEQLSDDALQTIRQVNCFDVELYDFAKSLLFERLREFIAQAFPIMGGSPLLVQLSQYGEPLLDRAITSAIDARFQAHRQGAERWTQVSVDFADAHFVSGWYPREIGKHERCIRWAGPGAVSSVYVPLQADRTYRFECRAHYVASHDVLKNLTLRVGDQQLPTRWRQTSDLAGQRMYNIQAEIPRESLRDDRPFSEIAIQATDHTRIEVANEDCRFVSLATDGFQLRAA